MNKIKGFKSLLPIVMNIHTVLIFVCYVIKVTVYRAKYTDSSHT